MTKKIIVVEDLKIIAQDLKETLEELGYEVPAMESSKEAAIKKVEEIRPDLVIIDIVLQGEKYAGIEAAQHIRKHFDIPVVYLSAYLADKNMLDKAKRAEPYGCITKPFGDTKLETAIEMALYKHGKDQKLKEREKRYRTFFEECIDAMYILSKEGKITDVNPAMMKLFGYTKKREVLGADVKKSFGNLHDWERFERDITGTGFVRNFEMKLRRKDGTLMNCLLNSTVRRDQKGNIIGYRGIIRVASEHKQVQDGK